MKVLQTLGVAVALAVLSTACRASVGDDSGDGGVGPDAVITGGACGNQTCSADTYCSATDVCIPVGTCASDDDCAGELRCGAGSRTCLADGACAAAGDCPDGERCNTDTAMCEIGSECGVSELDVSRVPPNVLVLLDRSGSMSNDAGGDSRWNVAKAAIGTVTQSFQADIRFGLATYSSCVGNGCSAGTIVVPIADGNAGAVNGYLADKLDEGSSDGNNSTGSGIEYLCDSGDPETSTGKSLAALVGEASLQDGARDNAVLLITDGEESGQCVENDIDGEAGAGLLLGQATPVKTYVVGLGINSSTLDAIAAAGGTGSSVPADNQAQLTAALADIAASVVSCQLVLDSDPPDPDNLHVFFDDMTPPVQRSPTNGWTYDESTRTITLHGNACQAVQTGQVTDIDVVFGCPEPVVD